MCPQVRNTESLIAGVCFSHDSSSLAGNLAAVLTGKVFAWLELNEEGSQGLVQSTPRITRTFKGNRKKLELSGVQSK